MTEWILNRPLSQTKHDNLIKQNPQKKLHFQKSSNVSALGIDKPRSLTACSFSLSDSCLACCSVLCSSRISSMETLWRIWSHSLSKSYIKETAGFRVEGFYAGALSYSTCLKYSTLHTNPMATCSFLYYYYKHLYWKQYKRSISIVFITIHL